jgi:hypothetical protein
METEFLSLTNICDGAAVEVFARELQSLLENIADVSTPADQGRSITLEFKFMPFPDRKGASVSFQCKGKLAGVEATAGTIFIAKPHAGSPIRAYIEDSRQVALFEQAEPSGSKQ